jgi:SAM-dependent methyltransferase
MSLLEEYRNQFRWRDWSGALALCPLTPGQRVLDLGCGPGDVSALLVARGMIVTGIDHDPELVDAARASLPDAHFEQQDLNELALPDTFDGIWCSFTAAYFMDLTGTLARWCRLLKPGGWICLIDVDDLLGHEPRSQETRDTVERFYREALEHRRYDFRVGRRLAAALEQQGFDVTTRALPDHELAFDGPAVPEVLDAWRARLFRMGGLKAFLGKDFPEFAARFIRSLELPAHRAACQVICSVGRRTATG